ncbi:DoxX family protein [Chitinilyticum piscinae]|uniref:DoxX family protein n=1 Tax=Chitinilyticum piscinae TaxID=2866724 RepID=A0A8J7K0I5_9NEIS|nr:DoxX family protein [Chitinilyticum piscinae]MBE9608111.1 DoxX family protein [Chitinilyticum piscinae]
MSHPLSHSVSPWGLTLLRSALGCMWIAHALLKWLVFTLPGTAQFFSSVGLPGWLAYPVFAAELLGGVALLLGFYARQVALLLLPIMLGAAYVHLGNGWVHTSPGGGWEYPVFLSLSLLALWLGGDGALGLCRSRWLVPNGGLAHETR